MAIRNLIIIVIAILLLAIYFTSGKDTIPYLAQTYLKNYGISYSKIEGSLINGFIIKDVSYKDSIKAKLLEVRYNPFSLIQPTPKIQLIRTEALYIDTNKLLENKDSNSSNKIFNFQISTLILNNTEVLYKDKKINFSTNIDSLKFNEQIEIVNIALKHATLKDTKNSINLTLTAKKVAYKKSLTIEKLKAQSSIKNSDYGKYSFDINSSNIYYKMKQINIQDFNVFLKTPYGDLNSKNAKLNKNTILASVKIKLNKNISDIYTQHIEGMPKIFNIDLNASLQEIDIKTNLNQIRLKKEQNLSLEQIALHVKYFINSNYFQANANYRLLYDNFSTVIKQKALFTTNLQFQSFAKMHILKTPINLPTKTIDFSLSGDNKFMIADLNSSNIQIIAKTYDYKQFILNSRTEKLPLNFIDKIPESLKDDLLTSKSNLVLDINPLFLRGEVKARDNHISTINHIEIKDHSILVKGDIEPNKDAKIYDTFDLDLVSNLNFVYFKNKKQNLLNIDANQINVTIFETNSSLKGWGNLNKNNFKVSGNIAKQNQNNIKLFATFPSIKTFLKELKIKIPKTKILYDAQVDINTYIDFSKSLKLSSTIEIPWFYVQPDDETTYSGYNALFNIEKKDNSFIINKYQLNFMEHNISSQKASTISIDENSTINVEEFWIYDSLLINGFISTSPNSIKLKVKSNNFTYTSQYGKISLKANINIEKNENEESIEGFITLLDGIITYLPKKDYSKLDNDIIIIQDIKESVINNRFINVHVNSKKPIKYKIDNVNIDFIPDFSIYKDKGSEKTTILGLVTINKGEIKAIDKTFNFQKSELYFYDINTNPQLNLNITHKTVDYIDVSIYITGDVEEPVIILSSKPILSQNDIMSYILFGEPTASSLNISNGTNNKIYISSLLIGSSIKSLLNKSDSINIDTINILTNDKGSLGYEIGSKINKNLRVIYKNNIISSIIVQYNINRALRIDVDVNQKNRGVSLIYIKDF